MRKNIPLAVTAVFVLLSFFTLGYTACKKDKCKNVTCANSGTCKEGNCLCTAGYGGKSCETVMRDLYQKSYKGDGEDNEGEDYPGSILKFSTRGTEINAMMLDISDANGPVNSFEVLLEANGAYSIVPKSETDVSYSGTGTISETEASLKLTIKGARTIEVDFPAMKAQ